MKVYLVMSVCDYEYGCTEVIAVFATEKQAQAHIDKLGQSYWTHWSDRRYSQYSIEEWEIEGE